MIYVDNFFYFYFLFLLQLMNVDTIWTVSFRRTCTDRHNADRHIQKTDSGRSRVGLHIFLFLLQHRQSQTDIHAYAGTYRHIQTCRHVSTIITHLCVTGDAPVVGRGHTAHVLGGGAPVPEVLFISIAIMTSIFALFYQHVLLIAMHYQACILFSSTT